MASVRKLKSNRCPWLLFIIVCEQRFVTECRKRERKKATLTNQEADWKIQGAFQDSWTLLIWHCDWEWEKNCRDHLFTSLTEKRDDAAGLCCNVTQWNPYLSTDFIWSTFVCMCMCTHDKKRITHFLLLPQVDSDAVDRHHDVDFLLLDVFYLELVLQKKNKNSESQINTLRFNSVSCSEGAAQMH